MQEGRYRKAYSYSEGFALVKLDNDEYAFIDRQGKLQEGRYEYADSYREGFADIRLKSGKRCRVDHKGNMYLSKKEWEEHISMSPQDYKFIPPHRFEDENFIKGINNIMKNILSSSLNDVQLNLSKIDESTKELQERILCVNSIMAIVDEKNKEVRGQQKNKRPECIEEIETEQPKCEEEKKEIEEFENLKRDTLNKITTLGV